MIEVDARRTLVAPIARGGVPASVSDSRVGLAGVTGPEATEQAGCAQGGRCSLLAAPGAGAVNRCTEQGDSVGTRPSPRIGAGDRRGLEACRGSPKPKGRGAAGLGQHREDRIRLSLPPDHRHGLRVAEREEHPRREGRIAAKPRARDWIVSERGYAAQMFAFSCKRTLRAVPNETGAECSISIVSEWSPAAARIRSVARFRPEAPA